MNTTHKVHHLSFGHHLLTTESGSSQYDRDVLLQKLLDRGHNPINLNLVEQPFVMNAHNATWEHFLRVVPEVCRVWCGWWCFVLLLVVGLSVHEVLRCTVAVPTYLSAGVYVRRTSYAWSTGLPNA